MVRWLALLLPLGLLTACASTSLEGGVNQIQLAIYHPLCIDVEGASTLPGVHLQLYPCGSGKLSQEWSIKPAGANNSLASNGKYFFINANSKLCMTVRGGPTQNDQLPGQKVIQADCNFTDPDMMWTIKPAPSGESGNQLVNAASGQCLDDPYGETAGLPELQQYTCTMKDPAQGWDFNSVGKGSTP